MNVVCESGAQSFHEIGVALARSAALFIITMEVCNVFTSSSPIFSRSFLQPWCVTVHRGSVSSQHGMPEKTKIKEGRKLSRGGQRTEKRRGA